MAFARGAWLSRRGRCGVITPLHCAPEFLCRHRPRPDAYSRDRWEGGPERGDCGACDRRPEPGPYRPPGGFGQACSEMSRDDRCSGACGWLFSVGASCGLLLPFKTVGAKGLRRYPCKTVAKWLPVCERCGYTFIRRKHESWARVIGAHEKERYFEAGLGDWNRGGSCARRDSHRRRGCGADGSCSDARGTGVRQKHECGGRERPCAANEVVA